MTPLAEALDRWVVRFGPFRVARRWLQREFIAALAAFVVGYGLACLCLLSLNWVLDLTLQNSLKNKRAVQNLAAEMPSREIQELYRHLLYRRESSWLAASPGGPFLPFLPRPDISQNELRDSILGSQQQSGRGALESRLINACLDKTRALWSYRIRRYANGWIQLFTLVFTFAGLFLVARRTHHAYWDYRLMEPGSVLVSEKHALVEDDATLFIGKKGPVQHDDDFRTYVDFLNSLEENLREVALPQGLVRVLQSTARAYDTTETVEEARERLDSGMEHLRAERESEGALIRYLAWAVPSIGFIGTVIGIGNALGDAHKVLGEPSQKQGAIQEITALLGTAFDTTLVALICSLVLMFCWHVVMRYEERVVNLFHEHARYEVVNKLSGLELEALFRKMLEGQTKELVALFEHYWKEQEKKKLQGRLELLEGSQDRG